MSIFNFFNRKKDEALQSDKVGTSYNQNFPGVCDTPLDSQYTPDRINTLGKRDIFVFGSNLAGQHAGGAAKLALEYFGAIWGQGEGLQGNSYAIPTMQGGIETIKPYVDKFIEFAEYEKALTFYVTKIGCGIAGFEIKDIAPLFRNAYYLPNVILPIEFAEFLKNERIAPLPSEIITHCHGITKTFADIILGLNEEKKYSSPEQAISDLKGYLLRSRNSNFACVAVKTFIYTLFSKPEIFAGGHLNASCLRNFIVEKDHYLPAYHKAYNSYCCEKLINLVSYLNEFRRYTSPDELRDDLVNIPGLLNRSACSPTPEFYYLDFNGRIYYPSIFFVSAVNQLWSEITTEGILDSQKMRQVMFGNHNDTVRQLGLEGTIKRDYIEDSPCHPEVFVPKVMGTGPIYVKKNGHYIRSCGEGKGPNSIPDWLEFQIAKQILENDKSYKLIGDYYIPKYDNTLPIYGKYSGRIVFNTQAEKLKFIEDVKLGEIVWR